MNAEETYDTELKPENTERLALLLEEMGESQQIIGKILRHGFFSFSPFDDTKTSNRRLLENELGDVLAAIEIMCLEADIDRYELQKRKKEKLKKVNKYLHFNKVIDLD